jgi:phenylalanyl-tRNA synthetase beta chain
LKLLYSWLREFVDLRVAPEELAARLTLCGFEVSALEPRSALESPPDAVLDIDVTTNRPDCLSVVGLAREVAAIYDLPLRLDGVGSDDRPPGPAEMRPTAADEAGIVVTLEEPDLCPRYVAAVAEVDVGPSPPWLAERLRAVGFRPINNVVDVTNYVMVELGHPLHAFDFDRLAGGELRVRRARAGERIRTLDGVDRQLAEQMLVIADRDRPQAIAGVMGGAASEVRETTRRVAFESAYFHPGSIRRTSRRLGLTTEASYRFERGADIEAPPLALRRALALLGRIGGIRAAGPLVDRYPHPRTPRTVTLRATRLAQVLGQAIDAGFVERTLERLGFVVTRAGGTEPPVWSVQVPTRRVDVAREVDLIEEVARHYGLDRLPARFPPLTAPPAAPAARLEREALVRRALTAAGFNEALTFSFLETDLATAFAERPEQLVPLANPLSAEFAVLRPSLVPRLVEAVAHNRRRQLSDVRLFEIGRRFSAQGEGRAVALAWLGSGSGEHWSAPPRPVDFFDIKGAVEHLCGVLGIEAIFEPARCAWLVAPEAAALAGRPAGPSDEAAIPLGRLGRLAASLATRLGLERHDAIYVAEIDLDAADRAARMRTDVTVAPLPRHPAVVRDLSVLVDAQLPAAALRGTIRAAAPPTLVSVREFDRYQGPGVPPGRLSLSFRLTFQAPDRTLTDAEVQEAVAAIVAALAREHGAVRR